MTVYSKKVPAPLTFRAASPEAAASISLTALEAAIDRIGGERMLAFVMEPVGGQATGANIAHPTSGIPRQPSMSPWTRVSFSE